jgi:CBS domain containing-hemolysin-like protein
VLFVLVSDWFPNVIALAICAMVIWFGFVWLPASRMTKIGARVAAWIAPPLAWLLNYLHPLFDRIAAYVRGHRPLIVHTGLYDPEDLIDLIKKQQVQTDNRIDKNGLEIARHALEFGDKLVRDFLMPRRVVKTVSVRETIGPKLMDDLHKAGHSRFPVYDSKPDDIVGTLYMKDLVGKKQGGTVKDLVRREVFYIHEEQNLYDVLQAILKTRHHMFVVINSFEEYVGIITMEDVLEQIIGKPIVDEFDEYDNLRAVAARAAREEHKVHTKEPQSEPEETQEVLK